MGDSGQALSAAGKAASAPRERRRSRRIPLDIPVGYEDREREVFLNSYDVSEGGMFLFAPDPPRPGSTAKLLIELPGNPLLLRLQATVVRRVRGERSGFALRFDPRSLSPGELDALRRFVATAGV